MQGAQQNVSAHRVCERERWSHTHWPYHLVEKGRQILIILAEIPDVALSGSESGRVDAPWPRQSKVATQYPRACSSPITSEYFSMNSVCP